jgi:diacylglycerol O-acyltransferase / wax synthase
VIDGVGLNMTVMSYRDHVDFGIIADRDQVDDVWSLMDGTAAALEELETVICGRRPAAANGHRREARPTAPA